VLKEEVIFYYKNEKRQGYIDLKDIKDVIIKDSKSCIFGLVTDDRTYYFKAENEEDMNEWVKEIKK